MIPCLCDDRVEHRAPAPETSLEAEEGKLAPVLGTSDLSFESSRVPLKLSFQTSCRTAD